MTCDEPLQISVVVPVYSGERYLAQLADALAEVTVRWSETGVPLRLAEVIFVDDESIDQSGGILEDLAGRYDWATTLHLSRNYGQHPATIAGILHSMGDWVVTMDEDLQHPPEKIEAMLALATCNGYDIVYAAAENAVHESPIRDLGSNLFKKLVGRLAGDRNVVLFNSFRVIRGPVARAASSVCGHETYFDIALSWFSKRVGTLKFDMKDNRVIGGKRSGYSLRGLASHARRMFMSAQVKTLRGGAFIGLAAMLVALFFATFITATEIINPGSFGAPGWGSLMVSQMFFGGLTLFLVGAVLEYVAVLVLRAQGKPVFFVIDRSQDARIASLLAGESE